MTIRLADPTDYGPVARLNGEVQQLHAEALPHLFKPASEQAFSRAVYEEMLARPRCSLYLAVADGEPVGYIYLEVLDRADTWFRRAHRVLYVHQLCVSSAHRRHGHGHRLLEHAAQLATQQGIAQLELDTWWFNTGARAFFARQGFEESNVRMVRHLP